MRKVKGLIVALILLLGISLINSNNLKAETDIKNTQQKITLEKQIEKLVKDLNEDNYDIRRSALYGLIALADKDPFEKRMAIAMSALIRALDDFYPQIRSLSSSVLERIGNESLIPVFEKLAQRESFLKEKGDPLNIQGELYIDLADGAKTSIVNIQKKEKLLASTKGLNDIQKAKFLINEIKNKNEFLPLILLQKIPQAAVPEVIKVLEEYGDTKMVPDGVFKYFDVQKNIEVTQPSWRLKNESDRPYQEMRVYLYKIFILFLGNYGDRKVIPFLEKVINTGCFVDEVRFAITNINKRR